MEALPAAGWELEVIRARRMREVNVAAREAVERGQEAVVVVGGDGTINEAVNALASTPVALGVIPAGTGNVLARQLGLPTDPAQACQMLLSSQASKVDLGKASFINEEAKEDSRYFLCMAGMGFDAKVVQAVERGSKSRLGIWAYVLTVAREAWRPEASQLRIRLDGETVEVRAWLLVVANAASYAWRLSMCPGAQMDDGLLDMCIFPDAGRLRHLAQVFGTLVTTHPPQGGVTSHRFREAKIEAEPSLPVQLDGDLQGTTPITVSVAPLALRILTPGGGPSLGQR